ncbi:Protein of unknown function precursor [Flavobacterium indicum GPTSA100-9 = DSM 17447]|uniref:C1q domain-containing protein n=1 Tax=Flavobacterium indicum (strain DSM 17447 / CIP 109464 / GPTSA100-9) TaxID=1094466 RepID=H8XVL2_FLAIG|nr:hypothetical protein [Flavobacterium indicum]CCG53976.1 Protein of unknown function precursor [Flavobacterium indicum GPTSA100-9 = DSM 17447]
MKLFFSNLAFLFFYLGFAQVGIGTSSPTESLDINGTLRIRTIDTSVNLKADSILVADRDGVVKRLNAKEILNNTLKTAVKGSFSSSALVNLTLLAGQVKIPFNAIEFDLNAEYNTATNTFTAKQDGIYQIYAQIKADNTLSISTNFGLAIYKNGTLLSRNSFANIGILGINATPPARSAQNLVQLNTGDTITFYVVSTLASVSILGEKEDCYFSILQVR